MPNITRRANKDGSPAFLIRVFLDENAYGKQKMKSMTWKPAKGMSDKAIEKELNRQVTLFEEKVKSGLVALDGGTRFEEYAGRWLQNAALAPTTYSRYVDLLKRINQAIGHIRLDKLQSHHLEEFYKNLKEDGIKEKGRYAVSTGLDKLMDERKLTRDALSKLAGIAASTVGVARKGDRITIDKANQIARALGMVAGDIFILCESSGGLSDKTVLHHHRLISSILAKAKKERLVPFNVAVEHADAPKVQKKEARYLDDEQARELVSLLLNEEDIRIKTALTLLLYSGLRRGELCGLSWHDVDFDTNVIHIRRASQYQKGKGVTEVPTKNDSSIRSIKLPVFMMEILSGYKIWWAEYRIKNGTHWKGLEQRLFVQANGKPINPDTINYWLNKFTDMHGLQHINPHALRHTFATLQIAAGVDIRTLQARTGHAQASTLVNIYSHAIKSAEAAASEALDNMLTPVKMKSKETG